MIELGRTAKPLAVQLGQDGPLIQQAQQDADAVTRLKARGTLTALETTRVRKRIIAALWRGLKREGLIESRWRNRHVRRSDAA